MGSARRSPFANGNPRLRRNDLLRNDPHLEKKSSFHEGSLVKSSFSSPERFSSSEVDSLLQEWTLVSQLGRARIAVFVHRSDGMGGRTVDRGAQRVQAGETRNAPLGRRAANEKAIA